MLRFIVIVAMIGAGFYFWNQSENAASSTAGDSPNGFVSAVMPNGASRNTVWVLAPKNCPSADAQRANSLVAQLKREGIPVVLSSSGSFETIGVSSTEREKMENSSVVLKGSIPAVFVNGMGKANPSAAEVLAEYRRTQ